MKLNAIIEKGVDGLYSIRTEQQIGSFCVGGYGESVEIAKSDFMECICEALEEQADLGINLQEIEVEYKYDMQSFFNCFEFFNTSKFAAYVGINESQMRKYKNGLSYPSEKTLIKILDGIHKIEAELRAISLLYIATEN